IILSIMQKKYKKFQYSSDDENSDSGPGPGPKSNKYTENNKYAHSDRKYRDKNTKSVFSHIDTENKGTTETGIKILDSDSKRNYSNDQPTQRIIIDKKNDLCTRLCCKYFFLSCCIITIVCLVIIIVLLITHNLSIVIKIGAN